MGMCSFCQGCQGLKKSEPQSQFLRLLSLTSPIAGLYSFKLSLQKRFYTPPKARFFSCLKTFRDFPLLLAAILQYYIHMPLVG